jgi:hypothetical protein
MRQRTTRSRGFEVLVLRCVASVQMRRTALEEEEAKFAERDGEGSHAKEDKV